MSYFSLDRSRLLTRARFPLAPSPSPSSPLLPPPRCATGRRRTAARSAAARCTIARATTPLPSAPPLSASHVQPPSAHRRPPHSRAGTRTRPLSLAPSPAPAPPPPTSTTAPPCSSTARYLHHIASFALRASPSRHRHCHLVPPTHNLRRAACLFLSGDRDGS
jgi:hypothetical protein